MNLDGPAAGTRAPEPRYRSPRGVRDPKRRLSGPPSGRVAQRAGIGAALSTAPVWVGRGRDEPRVRAGWERDEP